MIGKYGYSIRWGRLLPDGFSSATENRRRARRKAFDNAPGEEEVRRVV